VRAGDSLVKISAETALDMHLSFLGEASLAAQGLGKARCPAGVSAKSLSMPISSLYNHVGSTITSGRKL
jgi:hypothetical protein